MTDIRVRYLETRPLSDGTVGYYYCPPKRAKQAGVALPEALGVDAAEATRKSEAQNARIDAWRKEAGRQIRHTTEHVRKRHQSPDSKHIREAWRFLTKASQDCQTFLYVLQRGGYNGPIKIGIAIDVYERLTKLQTGQPEPLRLIGYVPGGLDAERALHTAFKADRLVGEWFKPSRLLLRATAELLWHFKKI